MFHEFTHAVADASGWAYAVIFVFAYLDAFLPVVPSEATVITGGVVAASGDLSLFLIIPLAAAGATLGDNTVYLIGHRFGNGVRDRFFGGEKAKKRIEWADRQLKERGGELIVVGRFIPGGRTAVSVSAGTLGYPWRRFVVFDLVAVILWASYAAFLGYFGGKTFESIWGLVIALLTAFAIAGSIELVRWLLRRRRD